MSKKKIVVLLSMMIVFNTVIVGVPQKANAVGEYLARDVLYSMTDSSVNRATSTHFQIVWGKNDQSGVVNDAFIQGNLKNLENVWTTYITQMGYLEPSTSIKSPNQTKKYKTNVYVTRTGLSKHAEGWAFMSSDSEGYGYIIVDPGAMRVDPPTWVLPHEFGHVVTLHQFGWTDSTITGAWWETTANWLCDQYLNSTNYQYNGRIYAPDTNFVNPLYMNSCLCSPHGRDYYDCWTILQYLTENPENYPYYGKDFVKTMIQKALMNEYPYDTIARLAPGVSIKDTLGNYAKRMATQDFYQKKLYREKFNQLIASDSNKQMVFTQLRKVSDKTGWWRVPIERAPQQTGFNIIPLTPKGTGDGRIVKVNFNGLIDKNRGSDWRVCLAVLDNSGNTRYSDLWNSGENSITLSSADSKVYLVVVATPDKLIPMNAFSDETASPFMSALEKQRFPYEVQITGADPYEAANLTNGMSGSRHPNGGGFVQNTAKVDSTAYVGSNAVVLGWAKVQGSARIEDYAVVEGSATVSGNAVVSGHAIVKDSAVVKDNAKVRDFAVVMNNSEVSGNARVLESAFVSEKRKITDNAVAKGIAYAYGEASISGEGIIDGDYKDSTNVNKGVAFGWLRGQEYASSRPYTASLYAGYEFGEASEVFAKDKYGVTNGILRGDPTWAASYEGHSGVLKLDGNIQYVMLENSLSDLKDIEIRASVFWDGGKVNQKLFAFGNSVDKCMYFTPKDENGKVKFEIKNGNEVNTLLGDVPLPVGNWSDVRIVLSGDTGVMYINNSVVAVRNDININPEDLNAPNVNSQSNSNFIGRGIEDFEGFFKGAIDSFYVYFKPLESTLPTPTPTPVIKVTPTPTSTIFKGNTISGYIAQDFNSSEESLKSGYKVEVVGTKFSRTTDKNGYFSISGIPSNESPYILRITKEGYLKREIKITLESSLLLSTPDAPLLMWAGDIPIDGVTDDSINMSDIMQIAKAFGSVSGEDKFSSVCDLNTDSSVNMADVIIIAKHFNSISDDYSIPDCLIKK